VEAAEVLSISRSSIYRLFDAGQLAWVQIGGSRRVASTGGIVTSPLNAD
jgi:excisionase family DNA binding protein